jgi:hypothetical protein
MWGTCRAGYLSDIECVDISHAISQIVMTGHSRLKDGVASLAYVPVIPMK